MRNHAISRAARPATTFRKPAMRSRERATAALTKVEGVWGLAKFSALATTLVGAALHLMGSAYHSTYLKSWGIDSGLFEKTTTEILISGHYVLLDRCARLIKLLSAHMEIVAGAFALTAICLWLVRHFKLFGRSNDARSRGRTPLWLDNLFDSTVKTYTGFVILLNALLVIFLVLLLPPWGGEIVGKSIAEKHIQSLAESCPAQPSTTRCVTLLRDGQSMAHGFIIDSSPTHIAIFDVATREARAIERHGLELKSELSAALPKSDSE